MWCPHERFNGHPRVNPSPANNIFTHQCFLLPSQSEDKNVGWVSRAEATHALPETPSAVDRRAKNAAKEKMRGLRAPEVDQAKMSSITLCSAPLKLVRSGKKVATQTMLIGYHARA